jgi:hypothetical protein
MAPDGSRLLTLDALSVKTAPDGSRRIVWVIKRMIKAHPTQDRMAGQAMSSNSGVGRHTQPQASR